MPSKFISGDSTYKYDRVVSEECLAKIDTLSEQLKNTSAELSATMDRMIYDNNREHQEINEKMNVMRDYNHHRLVRIEHFVYPFVSLLDTLCRKRLFRFFNFFFKLYQIDKENKDVIFTIPDKENPDQSMTYNITHLCKVYQTFIKSDVSIDIDEYKN